VDVVCVIATLGFEADFALRRLSASPKVSRLVCVGLRVDEHGWSRVERAFKLISYYCYSAQVDCLLEPLSITSIVEEFTSILRREASRCSKVELYLTGGPRLAVVVAVLTSAMVLRGLEDRVSIVVEGETFDARLEVPVGTYRKVLQLTDLEREIIARAIKESIKPSDLARELRQHKPIVYRKVRALVEAGLLVRVQGFREEYVASEPLRRLFKLVEAS